MANPYNIISSKISIGWLWQSTCDCLQNLSVSNSCTKKYKVYYFNWIRRYGEQDFHSAPTSKIFVWSVKSGLMLFLVYTIKCRNRTMNGSWDMENSFQISFDFYFVNLRAIGSWLYRFQVNIFQTKTTELDYLSSFASFSVDKFCRRTDRETDSRMVPIENLSLDIQYECRFHIKLHE